jgi:hypothetical protein
MEEHRMVERAFRISVCEAGPVIQRSDGHGIPCAHFFGTRLDLDTGEIVGFCKAYPEKIPYEIFNGDADHSKHYLGDHGIIYRPME